MAVTDRPDPVPGMHSDRDVVAFPAASTDAVGDIGITHSDLKLLVDASPGGVFRSGPDGNVIYAGGRLYERAGIAGAGAWGERWSSYLHPDHRAMVQAAWEQAVANQAPYKLEYREIGRAACRERGWTYV